jgi:hypothetical protein
MSSLRNLLAAPLDPKRREGTGYPFWGIVRNTSAGNKIWLDGPFFSREEGQRVLDDNGHEYGKAAFVYGFSGHRSESYKGIIGLAMAEVPHV